MVPGCIFPEQVGRRFFHRALLLGYFARLALLATGVYLSVLSMAQAQETATLTTLHNFQGNDGDIPQDALVQGADGNFYGTTSSGGANGSGTVFRITSSGVSTTLYEFNGSDGSAPADSWKELKTASVTSVEGSGKFYTSIHRVVC